MDRIIHSTFKLSRDYPHSPEKVFAAWATPEAKRIWFVDSDGDEWETGEYTLDFRVGGREAGTFVRNGTELHGNETAYLEITEGERIVFAYSMAMDGVPNSASLATVEFVPSADGCTLHFTEQGAYFGGSDGTEGRTAGWTWLLDALGRSLETVDA